MITCHIITETDCNIQPLHFFFLNFRTKLFLHETKMKAAKTNSGDQQEREVPFDVLMEEKDSLIATLKTQNEYIKEANKLFEESKEAKLMVEIYEEIIEDLVYEMIIEAHREISIEKLKNEKREDEERYIGSSSRTRTPSGAVHCECPNCLRPCAASRFTLHLVKCMTQQQSSRNKKDNIAQNGCLTRKRCLNTTEGMPPFKMAKTDNISDSESDTSEYSDGNGKKGNKNKKHKGRVSKR